jgi:hypothetical protein
MKKQSFVAFLITLCMILLGNYIPGMNVGVIIGLAASRRPGLHPCPPKSYRKRNKSNKYYFVFIPQEGPLLLSVKIRFPKWQPWAVFS